MNKGIYKLRAMVEIWPSENATWHLAYLPKEKSAEIRKNFKKVEGGWSSLPVEAKVGRTVWKTSIFFDRRSSSYILPLKVEVRKKEQIFQGDIVSFSLEIKP